MNHALIAAQADSGLIPTNPEFPSICTDAEGEVVLWHGGRSPEQVQDEILAIKDRLLAATDLHVEMPPEHQFVDGMYVRKLLIPAGTLIVGKIHLKDCINFVESGDISVMTVHGSKRLGPGFMGISHAGICKLGFAHADTVFVNVFRTDSNCVEEIERAIACEGLETLCFSHPGEVL